MSTSPALRPGVLARSTAPVALVARAGVALAVVGVATAVIGASAPGSLLTAGHALSTGVLPGVRLDPVTGRAAAILLVAGGYAAVLLGARGLSTRAAWIGVIVAHGLLLLGPVLFSTDVFDYVAYARLGALHGLDPYTHGSIAAAHDPAYRFAGWHHVASGYGPVFTLLTYPAALLSVIGAAWALKLVAVAAALVTVALTGSCARRLGRPVGTAVAAVGLNPLWLLWAVGGAHNDLLMLAALMVGVSAALAGRGARAAMAAVVAAMLKFSAIVALPYLLVRGDRRAVVVGAALAAMLTAAITAPAFGVHTLGFLTVIADQQHWTSLDSFPIEVARLGHAPWSVGRLAIVHGMLAAGLVYVAWRAYRTGDWLSGLAWGLLLSSALTPWYMPWYTTWPLPAAAVCRDRRALVAALALQGLVLVHRNWVLFS
jgi:glycosyl transferase family 87